MAHTTTRIINPTRYIPLINPFPKRSSIFSFTNTHNKYRTKLSLNHNNKPKSFTHFSTTMTTESESFQTADATSSPVVDNESVKFGFERDEMYKLKLSGSVNPPYDRHLFLTYKTHNEWPSHVENSESDPFPKLFASVLKARQKDIPVKTRLTICEGGEDVKLTDGDVLVFPEMVVYRGLKDSDVDSFVQDVLVDGKSWASGVQEELTGSYVFVCAHNQRDRRCGVCGPVLIDKFKEELESKDLKSQVFVTGCSHIGGHKYAGNVITFSAGPEGKVAGNWYGYVTPDDIRELLDKQIGEGEVIERIWRGQMGTPVIEAGKVDEPTNANGTTIEKQLEESKTQDTTESVQSCCQGANGFSCCKDDNVEPKASKKEVGGLSCWMGKLDNRQVLTTAAVVGAVVTVAVAYSLYRRAR